MVSWEYPPVVQGGLGRHVQRLAEGLVLEGVRVDVLTRGDPALADEESRAGVAVHRVEVPPFPAEDIEHFVAWVADLNDRLRAAGRELVEARAPDVVHGHDWLVAGACGSLAREAGLPYLTTIHATEFGRHHGWVGRHPQSHVHRTERRMAKRADGIVCCSAYMRAQVADVFGIGATAPAVIPNGVEPAAPAVDGAALRARLAGSADGLVLLAGRLVHEKGFQVALDALAAVAGRTDADVRYVVAGAGPYAGELRRRAQAQGLEDRVTFLGWVGDDVLASLYRAADACLVPSLYEPFGLVALEAMAAGCPCVVADTGGLRELVPEGTGLRVRPGDARALAAALERLLGDPALADRLAGAGAAHARAHDWAGVARRTRAIYAGLQASVTSTPSPSKLRAPASAVQPSSGAS